MNYLYICDCNVGFCDQCEADGLRVAEQDLMCYPGAVAWTPMGYPSRTHTYASSSAACYSDLIAQLKSLLNRCKSTMHRLGST